MKKLMLLVFCVVVAYSMVFSGDFTYIGAKKCKMCHKGEKKGMVFEKWQERPHSKAFEHLKAKGEENNPKCLECHTTAFNKGGYKIGAANAADFAWVGCEACHGPGSAYKKMSVMKDQKLAIENGLEVPTEETCKKCHNSNDPSGKTFVYKEYLKKIDHSFEKE